VTHVVDEVPTMKIAARILIGFLDVDARVGLSVMTMLVRLKGGRIWVLPAKRLRVKTKLALSRGC
jgi:hypothetical protein